jgi:hypothetical protein
MDTLRTVIFLVGVVLMVLGLGLFWRPVGDGRTYDAWLFRLGLLLAVAAHGWPAGLS